MGQAAGRALRSDSRATEPLVEPFNFAAVEGNVPIVLGGCVLIVADARAERLLPLVWMIGNLRPASDAEIERLLANPPEITRFLFGADAAAHERVSLDRAWHAIHFVLNGTRLDGTPPLDFLASEGTPIGDIDVGYGPARALTSQQVAAIAERLRDIEPPAIAARVDPRALDEHHIYPGGWQRNGLDAEYVVEHYRALRELILRLASDGRGLILYIN